MKALTSFELEKFTALLRKLAESDLGPGESEDGYGTSPLKLESMRVRAVTAVGKPVFSIQWSEDEGTFVLVAER